MFERLRKALSREAKPSESPAESQASQLEGPVSEWAHHQGFAVSSTAGHTVVVEGQIGGKPWKMELGKSTRNYIVGEELRSRAELGLSDDLAVMIMNRALKEAMERKAYSMITDTLQTTVDPNLPEEMRWLAMYDEVGWDSLPAEFWARYAVLTDRREHAIAWLDPTLAELFLQWPAPAPSPQVPFMMLIIRGKAYLRMEFDPPEMTTVEHAAKIFSAACEAAIGTFEGYPPT